MTKKDNHCPNTSTGKHIFAVNDEDENDKICVQCGMPGKKVITPSTAKKDEDKRALALAVSLNTPEWVIERLFRRAFQQQETKKECDHIADRKKPRNKRRLSSGSRSAAMIGSRNPMWGGDKIGLSALHEWVSKRLPKPELCSMCKKSPPLDLANKGTYDRDPKNWEWLCRRCHMKSDGRFKNLKQFSGVKLETR